MSMTENEALKMIKSMTIHPNCEMLKAFDFQSIVIKALEDLEQYRAIGTIEEFKDLKEKSVAKKPRFYAHNYYCTECGNLVGNNEFEWQRFLYCDNCGQKLDWQ